jgi:hypothetical protein
MKILQSFWTKPFLQSTASLKDARLNGGWPSRKYNYFSWALSCLQLLKYYRQVELVTDDLGKFLLIDKLQLPYTGVNVELNALDNYHPGLWALGKIYAYQLQESPFLHVDNDIFIWKEFDERITHAALTAQNRESNSAVYAETFHDIYRQFKYMPPCLRELEGAPTIPCSNTGIIGGTAGSFFKGYAEEIFAFLQENSDQIRDNIQNVNTAYLNVIYEQVIFLQLAKDKGLDITYLFPDNHDIPKYLGLFHAAGRNQGFVHCLGTYKLNRIVYEVLEVKLKTLYPEYYYRILDLMSSSEI